MQIGQIVFFPQVLTESLSVGQSTDCGVTSHVLNFADCDTLLNIVVLTVDSVFGEHQLDGVSGSHVTGYFKLNVHFGSADLNHSISPLNNALLQFGQGQFGRDQ